MSFSDPILFRGILFSTFALYSSSHKTPGGSSIAPGAMLEPPGVSWDEEYKANVENKIPLKRMGSEKDIANAVKFLVDANYITGQIIKVDGGRSL